jgi:protein SCO1/2
MPNKNKRMMMTVVGLLGVIALVLGLFISQQLRLSKSHDLSQIHGTLLDKPRDIHAFELMGIDNAPFNNASLQGHWTMVFFGFTNCGAICPTTMAELGKMYRLLEEEGAKTLPHVVMVSVDPERDSLDKLDHYVKAFDPHFYGARGEDNAVTLMTKEIGIAYTKIVRQGNEHSQTYDIDHTGTVILFNPRGELSAFFTMPHQASLLAKDYLLLIS